MLLYHIMENLQLSALCEIEQNNPSVQILSNVNSSEKSLINKNMIQQNNKEYSQRIFEFDTYIKKMNTMLSGYKNTNDICQQKF